ncbi:hypothetical protein [Pseudoalteromonas sp. McH1-42]|uniref:hypothetical protein n=1 Tax=Pseudoalteromonas sp. McH1-42 TaxID=2917752 RepID=UPI001EF439CF|nr:hypothetical protein [Pseudoalteromonas sp. McH1-42]MCG7563336.1 hypothetical protein [Pseudoalteromonas sp. McH1-42]
MNKVIDWLVSVWQSVIDWFYGVILFILNALLWVALELLDLLLQGFRLVFSAVEPPDFITSGLGSVSGAISPDVAYFLSATGFSDALAIVGLGYTFRITRKLLTLFQW